MKERVTKASVDQAVSAMNDAAERLGWVRRYRFQGGSNVNGIQHRLEVVLLPSGIAVESVQIGDTFAQAARFVAGMVRVLQDAMQEQRHARAAMQMPGKSVPYDPDSRTARRRD